MKISLPESPRRILVIRPRGLGDVVLASAVIDALSRAFPRAAIDFLSAAPSRALLEADTRLSRVFLLAKHRDRRAHVESGPLLRAVEWMRRAPPEIVFDLFSNPRTAIMTALSGSPIRVGLARSARRIAYNVRVPRFRGRPEDDHRWARDVMLDFLRFAGVRWEGEARLSLALKEEDHAFAARVESNLGISGTRWIALLPGGSWEAKRWPVEHFASVARDFARLSSAPVVVLWGPPEESDARAIERASNGAARSAPPSSIREMAALLGRASISISTDCFGRHVAVAQDVATVGVFGPTDPRDWTPAHGPHRTIGGPRSEFRGNIRAIPPAPVVEAAFALWNDRSRARADATLDASRPRT